MIFAGFFVCFVVVACRLCFEKNWFFLFAMDFEGWQVQCSGQTQMFDSGLVYKKKSHSPFWSSARLRNSQSDLNFHLWCHSESRLIEGVLVKAPINTLAQNANRILFVPGGHSFSSTSEKILYSPMCGWMGSHFFQCFSWAGLGLNKAQVWPNLFFLTFLLV